MDGSFRFSERHIEALFLSDFDGERTIHRVKDWVMVEGDRKISRIHAAGHLLALSS